MNNFIACCTRIAKRTSNKGNYFKPTKDYVLVYARNISNITWKFGAENKVKEEEFTLEDEKGKYKKNGASYTIWTAYNCYEEIYEKTGN
jgi:adenine-specific DNA-methyltransferase